MFLLGAGGAANHVFLTTACCACCCFGAAAGLVLKGAMAAARKAIGVKRVAESCRGARRMRWDAIVTGFVMVEGRWRCWMAVGREVRHGVGGEEKLARREREQPLGENSDKLCCHFRRCVVGRLMVLIVCMSDVG